MADELIPNGPAAFARVNGAETASAATIAAATLGLAAACWFVSVFQMSGMDMGTSTRLGSFATFIGVWVTMMAAMMLPSAIPAIVRLTHSQARVDQVAIFLGSYLIVWTLVGAVAYGIYRPHGSSMAGAVVLAAGVYELTPVKRHCRRRCRESIESGLSFGAYCVGSSIGLMAMMAMMAALGVMSVTWMAVIAAVVLGQKLVGARAVIDVPVAVLIIAFGVLIVLQPSWVPGLMPSM
jgi:predicted metal-binding membrane protein